MGWKGKMTGREGVTLDGVGREDDGEGGDTGRGRKGR